MGIAPSLEGSLLCRTEAEKQHVIRAYYERIGELPLGDTAQS